MAFSDIANNQRLISQLKQTIAGGDVPHAYIIEAPASVDKAAFATAFAQALLCREKPGEGCGICPTCRRIAEGNHLDVPIIEATQKKGSTVSSVKDEDVLQVQERLSGKPLEGERSVAIVRDADTMTPRAFNRFLKTLEEPVPGTVILLLSENMQLMPATIRSRCLHIRLQNFAATQTEELLKEAGDLVEAVKRGDPFYRLKEMIEKAAGKRQDAFRLMDAMESEAAARLTQGATGIERKMLYRLIGGLESAREEIKRGDRPANALKKMILTEE